MSEELPRPAIEENGEYEVDIVGRGKTDGVAKIDNFVIFVPGTDIGDTHVKIRVVRVLEKYALARKVIAFA